MIDSTITAVVFVLVRTNENENTFVICDEGILPHVSKIIESTDYSHRKNQALMNYLPYRSL